MSEDVCLTLQPPLLREALGTEVAPVWGQKGLWQ